MTAPTITEPKALLVTGMHRSGTSALMGVCNILGIRLPNNLYAADATNPKGYWEPKEIVDAHDTLLAELGRSWRDTKPLPPGWLTSDAAAICRSRITGVLTRDFTGVEIWGVKDPRMCLLLPLWTQLLESLGAAPYILHIFRNPNEVANSLLKRVKFPVDAPYDLWLRYVLDAERDSRPYRRVFISYDALLKDWYGTLTWAAELLGFRWPADPGAVKVEVDTFLSQELRHERAETIQDNDQTETAIFAHKVYEALINASNGDEEALVGASDSFLIPKRRTSGFMHRKSAADFDDPEAVRAVAFYLPQFHPIPENDQWWGKGYTEWTKVSRAVPKFAGHYQPHLPADLGFYDLRVPEVRLEQAALARKYGISGFCYYYYWFAGKRLLERPFEEILKSGEPDFPFCLCWANENWTRRWDGADQEVLIAQQHSHEDDLAFIRALIPAFRDPRYIRLQGRPLLLVYRPGIFPEPRKTVARWREACITAGVGNPYLCMIQSFGSIDPRPFGLDAAVEFPPHNLNITHRPTFPFKGKVGLYEELLNLALNRPAPAYTWFRGVIPSWDNTPRRGEDGMVIHGSRPQLYDQWLSSVVQWTRQHRAPGERLVFINAWNEWGEGCHLEPDAFYGHGYLQATWSALQNKIVSGNEVRNIDQLLRHAVEYLQSGRFNEAENLYQQILAQEPNHPGALHVIGLLKYQNGDMQGAIAFIEKAIEHKADFAEAYKNAANIYAELGRMDNAITMYQRALEISPELDEAHLNLATIYVALQRYDEAKRHYESALLINPDLADARDKLTEVLRFLRHNNQ